MTATHSQPADAGTQGDKGGDDLRPDLSKRHLTMISMGGTIGAGFFVGLSGLIVVAGPAAIFTTMIAGAIVYLVMRMLGEMAVARPSTGSFVDYARFAMGRWAGFATGWLYWYFWVIVVGIEAVVGGDLIARWVPSIPQWLTSVVILVIMISVNLLSVRSFGEAEYWFAGIKVAVISAFIVAGIAFLLGLWDGAEPNTAQVANLFDYGGFAPNGVSAIFVGVVTVIFSMTGAELVTIAAAESSHPADSIRRTTQTVVVRILAFFVISTALLVMILPWNEYEAGISPFVAALDSMGVTFAADLLNFIVLVAVLSCLNAGLYTASRMIFTQGRNGDAPGWMTRVNSRGVPTGGILVSGLVGFICVGAGYVWPDTIFLYLVNSSGAVVLFVYVFIGLSQIIMRPRFEMAMADKGGLSFKMIGWPVVPALITGLIVVIIIAMGLREGTRAEFTQSMISLVVFVAIGLFLQKTGIRGSYEGVPIELPDTVESDDYSPGRIYEDAQFAHRDHDKTHHGSKETKRPD
ncbi:amino acid permease [Corynebacterium sp. TAE3-ERU12]|uniref:amino acid permease n=1 Tax=Corynebacterium sp. TAE3-ERU12 TaxID=2849491 RepID=UPI001C437055|nr:amino acid permease [Corynebacterium sp. TAE3-ERU12]MBV7296002.1 amino acid permease [Corynebacterium sp. TAE3-ERU12]